MFGMQRKGQIRMPFLCWLLLAVMSIDLPFQTCLSSEWLLEHNIIPGFRPSLPPVSVGVLAWDSAILASYVFVIVFTEAMGFDTETTTFSGFLDTYVAIENGEINFVPECWLRSYQEETDELIRAGHATVGGLMGYTGDEGIFISTNALSSEFFSAGIEYESNNFLDNYILHYNAEARKALFIDPCLFIYERPMLKRTMVETCGLEYNTVHLPRDEIFLPAVCSPIPRGTSTRTYVSGFETVPLRLHTGEIVFLDTTTQIIPETCIIWHMAAVYWSVNEYQALIANLGLETQLYFWGLCRLRLLVDALVEEDLPAITYGWTPDDFMARNPLKPVTFPAESSTCFDSHSTDNTWGMNSTIDCDASPEDLKVLMASAYWDRPDAADGTVLVTNLHISKDAINNMLVRNYNMGGSAHWEVACEFLRNNTDNWAEKWLPQDQYSEFVDEDDWSGALSLFEIVAVFVGVAVFIVLLFLTMLKVGDFSWMPEVADAVWFMGLKAIGDAVFDLLDCLLEVVAFFTVINVDANTPPMFAVLYLMFTIMAMFLTCISFYYHKDRVKDIYITSMLKKRSTRVGNMFGSEKTNKERQKKEGHLSLALLFGLDIPFFTLNLVWSEVITDSGNVDWSIRVGLLLSAIGIGSRVTEGLESLDIRSVHTFVSKMTRKSTQVMKDIVDHKNTTKNIITSPNSDSESESGSDTYRKKEPGSGKTVTFSDTPAKTVGDDGKALSPKEQLKNLNFVLME